MCGRAIKTNVATYIRYKTETSEVCTDVNWLYFVEAVVMV